jgi:alpha-mannosidase
MDVTELNLWDWPGDVNTLKITDHKGNMLPFQILMCNAEYDRHKRTDILVQAHIPSMGWQLIIVDEDLDMPLPFSFEEDVRVHTPHEFILENEIIHAEINPVDGTFNLTDKRTGRVAAENGGFYTLTESRPLAIDWGTAWIMGRYKNDETLCVVDNIEWALKGELRNAVKVTSRYNNSKLTYVISLDKDAEYVTITASVDWLEVGSWETGLTQLRFAATNPSASDDYLYDIPFGSIKRPATEMDMPGQSYVCSLPDEKNALAILSRTKYAYRCTDTRMALTLIRSTCDPDPYPELGRHSFTFHLALPKEVSAIYLGDLSKKLFHPVFAQSVTAHNGTLPAKHSLMKCDATVSCVKLSEDGSRDIVIRLFNDTENEHNASVVLAIDVVQACLCSITEVSGERLTISDGIISVPLSPHKLASIRVVVK